MERRIGWSNCFKKSNIHYIFNISDNVFKFDEIIKNKTVMKAWVIAFQQYRLSGKFILNEEGYNNMAKILTIILNEVSLSSLYIYLFHLCSAINQKKLLSPKKFLYYH